MIKNCLNPEEHQNPISGSKVTAILLNGWICPFGGVASGRVGACSLHSRLVYFPHRRIQHSPWLTSTNTVSAKTVVIVSLCFDGFPIHKRKLYWLSVSTKNGVVKANLELGYMLQPGKLISFLVPPSQRFAPRNQAIRKLTRFGQNIAAGFRQNRSVAPLITVNV